MFWIREVDIISSRYQKQTDRCEVNVFFCFFAIIFGYALSHHGFYSLFAEAAAWSW